MKLFLCAVYIFLTATVANAAQVVQVIWPFGLAGSHGAMWREIATEANRSQQKYQFIVESKPGGGGVVAINYVLSQKTPTILIHTGSYFLSPAVPGNTVYDVDQFKITSSLCLDQPYSLVSKKFATVKELDAVNKLDIGSIRGSATSLVFTELSAYLKSTDTVLVPFKGTPEMIPQILGGHIDASTGFVSDALAQNLNIVGITGTTNHSGLKTFESQGVKGLEHVTASYYMFMPKKSVIDSDQEKEIIELFSNAAKSNRVGDWCRKEFGQHIVTTHPDVMGKIFEDNKRFWHSQGQKLAK